jgi:hypothetical protein
MSRLLQLLQVQHGRVMSRLLQLLHMCNMEGLFTALLGIIPTFIICTILATHYDDINTLATFMETAVLINHI